MDADIERAVQSVIHQYNSAIVTAIPDTAVPHADKKKKKKKKKKKRAREGAAGEDAAGVEDGRKEKKRAREGAAGEDAGGVEDGRKEKKRAREGAGEGTAGVEDGRKKKKRKKAHHPPAVSGPADSLATSSDAHPGAADASAATEIDSGQDGLHGSQAVAHASSSSPTADPVHRTISQFSSNDDILKAFQELDATRIAGALRSLDIPLSTPQSRTSLDNDPGDRTDTMQVGKTYSSARSFQKSTNHTTATSSARRHKAHGLPSRPPHSQNRSTRPLKTVSRVDFSIAPSPSIASPEHTQLLASKWLNPSQLKSLVESEGLVYKKGKFSAIEEQALNTAIENYRVNNGLSQEQLVEIIFSKSRVEAFWPELTSSLPARPITSVYQHVQRSYHPLKCQGKWLEEEDDVLIKAVGDHGRSWTKISEMVGRTPQDCRDRWKNHLVYRSDKQQGHWTKREEEELTRIVTEITEKQGEHTGHDIFWGVVSQRMGNKRTRQQCRTKWNDCLIKTVKTSGNVPRWNKHDTFRLIQKVASLDVRDDTEIDWNTLSDPDWNLWSAYLLQRRWRLLKVHINGHESMTFRGIVEILRNRYCEPSDGKVKQPRQNPRKEFKSAEFIEEDDDDG